MASMVYLHIGLPILRVVKSIDRLVHDCKGEILIRLSVSTEHDER